VLSWAAGRRGDRGASVFEYLALGALAVILVAGLVTAGVGRTLAAGTARVTSCAVQDRTGCAARARAVPAAGTPRTDAPRKKAAHKKGGCHGFLGCTWSGAKNVGGGTWSAVKDTGSGMKSLVTTNPVTTGKALSTFVWHESPVGQGIRAWKACGAGRYAACGDAVFCATTVNGCMLRDVVIDDKTRQDTAKGHWGDATGRVLWNGGSLLIPTKIPGLSKLGRFGRAGEEARVPVGAERAPAGSFEKAQDELKDLRRDESSSSDVFLLHGAELARKFLALAPGDRTRLLDTMTRDELRAFYRDAGGFDENLPSDVLQAASRDALAKIHPAEPVFTHSGGWHLFTGDLWEGFPVNRDVAQGSKIGDCWCLAASQSMASAPRGSLELQKMFTKNPNGTYTVTFGDGRRVTVTPMLPVNGALVADRAGWPAIMEKAMAVRTRGGYDGLTGSSPSSVSLKWLTGRDAEVYIGRHDMPDLATVRTWWDDQDPLLVGFPRAADIKIPAYDEKGIIPEHVYSVRDVDPHTGIVTLLNPHGPGSAIVTINKDELAGTSNLRLYRGRLPERGPVEDEGPLPDY
jgi:hypothetical protein